MASRTAVGGRVADAGTRADSHASSAGAPAGSRADSRESTGLARSASRETLPRAFYDRPVLEVARDLIGCVVEHDGMCGAIVETEAYHESEPACHAFVGVTPRTRTLFGEPGVAYVYRSYGIHALLNAVCEPAGVGAAVLIRALEPLVGVEEMRMRRARGRERDLCSGPGKLTQALGVELRENGTSLLDGPIAIRPPEPARAGCHPRLLVGTRVGITKAVDLRWRFCAAGNPHVSRPPVRDAATVKRA